MYGITKSKNNYKSLPQHVILIFKGLSLEADICSGLQI